MSLRHQFQDILGTTPEPPSLEAVIATPATSEGVTPLPGPEVTVPVPSRLRTLYTSKLAIGLFLLIVLAALYFFYRAVYPTSPPSAPALNVDLIDDEEEDTTVQPEGKPVVASSPSSHSDDAHLPPKDAFFQPLNMLKHQLAAEEPKQVPG